MVTWHDGRPGEPEGVRGGCTLRPPDGATTGCSRGSVPRRGTPAGVPTTMGGPACMTRSMAVYRSPVPSKMAAVRASWGTLLKGAGAAAKGVVMEVELQWGASPSRAEEVTGSMLLNHSLLDSSHKLITRSGPH